MKKFIVLFASFLFSMSAKTQNDSTTETKIYDFTQKWVGTKYRVGGNTLDGIDCSGFSKLLYDSVYNIQIPRTAREQYKHPTRVKRDSLKAGDLVFFRVHTRTTWHVGVYLSDGLFVHAANRRKGVIVSSLNDNFYSRTFISGGRAKRYTVRSTDVILHNQFMDYVLWLQTKN